MNKLKCIKHCKTDECFRIDEGEAIRKVATGNYTFTTKGKYKKYIKDKYKAEYKGPSGIYGSSYKTNNKGEVNRGNNRKTTRGRNAIQHIKKLIIKHIKSDIITITSIAAKYKSKPDPLTGAVIVSKSGRKIPDKSRVVYKKGSVITRTKHKGVRHIKYAKDNIDENPMNS